jgi:hypothetical protein
MSLEAIGDATLSAEVTESQEAVQHMQKILETMATFKCPSLAALDEKYAPRDYGFLHGLLHASTKYQHYDKRIHETSLGKSVTGLRELQRRYFGVDWSGRRPRATTGAQVSPP